jgi:integrase
MGSERGIYAYETAQGTRFYFKYRSANGRSATKRGFTSQRAARRAREQMIVAVSRGEVAPPSRETFGEFYVRWLRERRPYLEPGTHNDYRLHGVKRMATLDHIRLTKLDTATIKSWLASLVEQERYATKTINNSLTVLTVCLNHAVRDGLIPANPARAVQRLPDDHMERDYLRLEEIPIYLDGCSDLYRPLAELLIATGMRIGEAVALVWEDVDFANNAIRVMRSRKASGVGSTKSDRSRAVDFGPRLGGVLRELRPPRCLPRDPIFVGPGRWPSTSPAEHFDRSTVSRQWHKHALKDASLRDMPLHSLRHTAAAAWLTTGQPLVYVQRQLGHASITTTERFYGHLETTLLRGAAAATESVIWGSA